MSALPLAAIKIVNKNKVACAQNIIPDPCRLLYKQYKFCEKQKELTAEFKAKGIFNIPFKMFPKRSKIFDKLMNIEFYRDMSQRNVTAAIPPSPPPHPPQT